MLDQTERVLVGNVASRLCYVRPRRKESQKFVGVPIRIWCLP